MKTIIHGFDDLGVQASLKDLAAAYFTDATGSLKYGSFQALKDNIAALDAKTTAQVDFKAFLEDKLEKILTGKPSKLAAIIRYVEWKYPGIIINKKGRQSRFGRAVAKCFNFKSYRGGAKLAWLSERFRIKSCVYCNSQYAIGVEGKYHKQLLFQLDHFHPQKKYPYLSLSFFNLLPTCGSCNNAKSDRPLQFLNPFVHDASAMFVFRASQTDVLDYLINDRTQKIAIDTVVLDPAITDHLAVFKLKEIANQHDDIVEELYLKAYYYDKTKQDELKTEFDTIINQDVINRFMLGNFPDSADINKRPLAKFMQDIAVQIGLLP